MSFIHWWAVILGGIGVVAPVAVHFMTKPKPRAYPLSTISMLREIIQDRRAVSRFKDWLILILRTLAVALFALAIARPLIPTSNAIVAQPENETARVIVLDVSQSLSAGVAGASNWQRAQASAISYLEFAPNMQAAVVIAGATSVSVFDRLSPNLNSLKESVRQVSPVDQRVDAASAMNVAARLLERSSAPNKELILISDFQRSNWGGLSLDQIDSSVKILYESVSTEPLENVAITAVRFPQRVVAGQPALCEVDVANYSTRPVDIRCDLELTHAAVNLSKSVPPDSVSTLTASIVLPETGWEFGWAKLRGHLDAQPRDDQRAVAIEVRGPPRVAILSRQPTPLQPCSSFYLESALRVINSTDAANGEASSSGDAEGSNDGTKRVMRIQPQRTAQAQWPAMDCIVINHPGALDEAALDYLANRIRRGLGVLYVASEMADATNLQQLAERLGKSYQPPVELVAPANIASRKNLFINKLQSREAPFKVFGDNAAQALQPARFEGGLDTRATSEGLRDQVLAELSDTSAFLFATDCDGGQLMVLNCDLDKSNFCTQPTFLPILSEIFDRLVSSRSQFAETSCGEPMVRLFSHPLGEEASLSVSHADDLSPKGDEYGNWEWSTSQNAWIWTWTKPTGAGVYRVTSSDSNDTVFAIASNAPDSEADLRTLDREVLVGRLASGRSIGFRSSNDQHEEEDSIWNWLIVACLIGLTSEIVALRLFKS